MIALNSHPDDGPPPDGYGQAQTEPPEGYNSWPAYMQDISEQAHAAGTAVAAARSRRLLVRTSVHHGNTARVAKAMADVLGAECLAPEDCPYDRLADCQLLGIGSGIYYGRMHDAVWRWVRNLPNGFSGSPAVFIFSTSGLSFLSRLWHRSLREAIHHKGFRLVGEFACRGFDTWGPLWLAGGLNRRHPDERDLQRAREFARGMAEQVSRPLGGSGRR